MSERWQRSASAAGQVLASNDGRWVLASTSVTALVAGAVAWLAPGILPEPRSYRTDDRPLMPYQVFLKLTRHSDSSGAAYAGMFPPGNTFIDPRRSTAPSELDGALLSEREGKQSDSSVDTRTITLDRGDTLVGALVDAGVSQSDANAVILALAHVFDPKAIKAGESFGISFTSVPDKPIAQIIYTPPQGSAEAVGEDDSGAGALEEVPATPVGKLLSLSYSPEIGHEITITRSAAGQFIAQEVRKSLKARFHRAGATIDSSLYLAAMRAGIPADVVVKMIHMFSYEVDFQRDLKPGDSFEVLYNYYYTPDGQPAKEGEIQYAALNFGGHSIALYRYQPRGEVPQYFDGRGASAR
ncbi:MAG: hypothetical protein JOY77_12765, partial [Alphaproteobacteria bacterium]|nr:hypothetical protein [Alphaproteobacteria bacterium]